MCWATHGGERAGETPPPGGEAAGPRLRIERDLNEGSGAAGRQLFSSFKVAGRSFRTSATIPTCATSKIGALGSVLIAMIRLASFMPATCCIAPLIPHATYSFGRTVLPLCPTCLVFG